MTSFANLKRNRNSFEKLSKAVEATSTGSDANSKDDNRFWQPEVDKAGNGMAVIRFLPAPAVDGDDALPWVRTFSHGFQGPGGWFIDNCLTTLNEKCPVCEHNNTLWNSGIEANKDVARKQKRKLSYVANILVVSDPSNPSNEGQIKLFKFGKKIFDKITEAMNPEFADETPVNPFDMWEGANFKLKIRNVEGYRNYDKSEFADVSALFDGNDEKLEELWKKEFSLKDFTERKNFKPYDQLKGRLDKVLGFSGAPIAKTKAEDTVASFKEDTSVLDKPIQSDDDDLDYFKSLAESD
tara:strand:- start:3594 stop:4481 length:888 start_codon:yes stop_codon:yes gene_type:complete